VVIKERPGERQGGENDQQPDILNGQHEAGVGPKAVAHGGHGSRAARHRAEKSRGRGEPGVTRQNPAVQQTGQENENDGEEEDTEMPGQNEQG